MSLILHSNLIYCCVYDQRVYERRDRTGGPFARPTELLKIELSHPKAIEKVIAFVKRVSGIEAVLRGLSASAWAPWSHPIPFLGDPMPWLTQHK